MRSTFHEDAVNDMWSRALKGSAAANYLRGILATGTEATPAPESDDIASGRRSPATRKSSP